LVVFLLALKRAQTVCAITLKKGLKMTTKKAPEKKAPVKGSKLEDLKPFETCSAEMRPLKKLTPKTVLGKVSNLALPLGSETPVYRVIGIANSMTVAESETGSIVKFKGDFYAVSLVNGNKFVSSVCVLPGDATKLAEEALIGLNSGSIEFAFDVMLQTFCDSSSYEFASLELVSPRKASPLDALLSMVGESYKLPGTVRG